MSRTFLKRAAAWLLALSFITGTLGGCSGDFISALSMPESPESLSLSAPAGVQSGTEEEAGSAELAAGLFDDNLAYSQLTAREQDVYAQLYAGIRDLKQEFSLRASDSEDIKRALSAVVIDCPEFFWIDGAASMSGYAALGSWTITLNYVLSPEEIPAVRDRIETRVREEYLASLPEGASDYDKVRAAYEYIINITDYSLSSEQNQNIMSVFLNGLSVCAGYARAFKYLLDSAGVWCGYVEGIISDTGDGHAWNIVRIDGSYTYVDPSWGDPTYGEDNTDAKRLKIIYDYLCLTEDEMLRAHHEPETDWVLPSCTDRSHDYYILNGLYYEGYSESTLSSVLWNAVDNAIDTVYLKYSDLDSYLQAKEALFPSDDDASLIEAPIRQRMEWDEASSLRYYYSCSDELWIIKIYW